EENPKYLYTSSGLKNVILKAITDQGCISVFDTNFTFGDKSLAEFSWQNECFGDDSITFIADTDEGKIISFRWEFGDGDVFNDTTVSEPKHLYESIGRYDVSLMVETGFGCVDTIKQTVHIRPYIKFQEIPDNYYQDFENGITGWVEESTELDNTGSWELGFPSGEIINTPASGINAWYTDINKEDVEQSWISSPCFDFSSLKKPMIKLNIWSAPEKGRNGAVLQSSVDEGNTWSNVGTLNDGINWYNSFSINGAPGGQAQGWSGGPDSNWVEARHSLDELVGEENVRFRIAFGADGNALNDFDGFAFDNIWIGERSRIVLLEHFTNSNDNASAIADGIVNPIVNNHPLDVVDIQYHTSYPESGPLNLDNQSDPSARTLYYGIPNVPYTIMDGDIINSYNYTTSIFKEDSLNLRSLVDPEFSIDLTTEITNGSISIDADITAIDSIPAKDITVQIVVIEKEITLSGEGTIVYESVLKKMLPDAGGTNFSQRWLPGETKNINTSWNMENVYDQEQIKVVVFVQNKTTKEVLQTTTDDTSSVSTGIFPQDYNNTELAFKIYPNPTSGKTYLLFSRPLKGDYFLQIFSNLGTLIEKKALKNEVQYLVLDTENYQSGIYFIQIIKGNRLVGMKRLSVVH
ncbi:MAG: PKD domain-containing protein, partial [Bacteroidales bacterium]|nr:PKD domain-containing protein [Bacteroidales bacterium]